MLLSLRAQRSNPAPRNDMGASGRLSKTHVPRNSYVRSAAIGIPSLVLCVLFQYFPRKKTSAPLEEALNRFLFVLDGRPN
jgi:hypothetical protein